MKWFDAIACDNAKPNPYVADQGDLGMEDWLLRQGKQIENWSEQSWVKASTPDDDGDPDDVLQSYLGVPIYSIRFRSALREHGVDDIQYLPLRVLRPDGDEIKGFTVANITTVRDALDREQSDISLFGSDYVIERRRGQISAVRKPVLLASRLADCDIFRLEGYLPAYYVSERFKEVFERGKFTGYSFREVKVRDNGARAQTEA
jgi:hypothetical protein